jgi:alkaline phosphatase D
MSGNRTRVVLVSLLLGTCVSYGAPSHSETLSRIAFGSCANQLVDQPIWDAVADQNPDLFLFIGDAIYADYDGEKVVPVTGKTLLTDWQKLGDEEHFSRFRETTDILATWDNHDYGSHDGGAEFPLKSISKNAFLDFFDEPAESTRRSRPGIYDAKIFGEADRRVQVILLDTRYFKSPPVEDERSAAERHEAGLTGSLGKFAPNTDRSATLLGAGQWDWLEQQLLKQAEIRLLVSSTQVIPDQKGMDEWGNYPHERQRLFDVIASTKASGVILLTGNIHFAEVSILQNRSYPLIEFSSSGLTHTNSAYAKAPNDYRVGAAYDELNFGLVDIDWHASPSPQIQLQVIDENGQAVHNYTVSMSELQPAQ